MNQEGAVQAVVEWMNDDNEQTLSLAGYAGTGKTFLAAKMLPSALDIGISFCAPTGQAAQVLTSKGAWASTIHSLIYTPRCGCGKWCGMNKDCPAAHFDFNDEREYAPLIVVDETSMVTKDVYEDLLLTQSKILFVGDHGQLPPVDAWTAGPMVNPDIVLDSENRRSGEGNPVLYLAQLARNGQRIPPGTYSDPSGQYPDSLVIPFSEWDKSFTIASNHLIITPYNSSESAGRAGVNQPLQRVEINKKVVEVLRAQGITPDRVICLRNAARRGIFNGMKGTLRDAKPYKFSEDIATLTIKPDDADFVYKWQAWKAQFNSAQEFRTKVSRSIDLWDYAYALTCHKAQGGEADHVTVVGQQASWAKDRSKWLYTAITRAKETVTLIGV